MKFNRFWLSTALLMGTISAHTAQANVFDDYKIEPITSDSPMLGVTNAAPFTQINEYTGKFEINLPGFGPGALHLTPKYKLHNRNYDPNFAHYDHATAESELGNSWEINPFGFLITAQMTDSAIPKRWEEVALVRGGFQKFTRDQTFRSTTAHPAEDNCPEVDVCIAQERDAHFIDDNLNRLTREYSQAFGQSYYYLLEPSGRKIKYAPEHSIDPASHAVLRYYPVEVTEPNGRKLFISYTNLGITQPNFVDKSGATLTSIEYTQGRFISSIVDEESRGVEFVYSNPNNSSRKYLSGLNLRHFSQSGPVGDTKALATFGYESRIDHDKTYQYLSEVKTPEGLTFGFTYEDFESADLAFDPLTAMKLPTGGIVDYSFENFTRSKVVQTQGEGYCTSEPEGEANLIPGACLDGDYVDEVRLHEVTHSGAKYTYDYQPCNDFQACTPLGSNTRTYIVTVEGRSAAQSPAGQENPVIYRRETEYINEYQLDLYIPGHPDFDEANSCEYGADPSSCIPAFNQSEFNQWLGTQTLMKNISGRKVRRNETYNGETKYEKWQYTGVNSPRALGHRGDAYAVYHYPIKSYSQSQGDNYWQHAIFEYEFDTSFFFPIRVSKYRTQVVNPVDTHSEVPSEAPLISLAYDYVGQFPQQRFDRHAEGVWQDPYWLSREASLTKTYRAANTTGDKLMNKVTTTYADSLQRPLPTATTKYGHVDGGELTLHTEYYDCTNSAKCGQAKAEFFGSSANPSRKVSYPEYQFGVATKIEHPGTTGNDSTTLKPETIRVVNFNSEVTSETVDGVTTTFTYDDDGRQTRSTPDNGDQVEITEYAPASENSQGSWSLSRLGDRNLGRTVQDIWGRETHQGKYYANNSDLHYNESVFDSIGLVDKTINANGTHSEYLYDVFGRPVKETVYENDGADGQTQVIAKTIETSYNLINSETTEVVEVTTDHSVAGDNSITRVTRKDYLGRTLFKGIGSGSDLLGTDYQFLHMGNKTTPDGASYNGLIKMSIVPQCEDPQNNGFCAQAPGARYSWNDLFGRPILEVHPEEKSVKAFQYDSLNGELVSTTRHASTASAAVLEKLDYIRDALGRETQVKVSRSGKGISNHVTAAKEYYKADGQSCTEAPAECVSGHGKGQLASATQYTLDGNSVKRTFTYDERNRIQSVTTKVNDTVASPAPTSPANGTMNLTPLATLTLDWALLAQSGAFYQWEFQGLGADGNDNYKAFKVPAKLTASDFEQSQDRHLQTIDHDDFVAMLNASLSPADAQKYIDNDLNADPFALLNPTHRYRWRVRAISKNWTPTTWSGWQEFGFEHEQAVRRYALVCGPNCEPGQVAEQTQFVVKLTNTSDANLGLDINACVNGNCNGATTVGQFNVSGLVSNKAVASGDYHDVAVTFTPDGTTNVHNLDVCFTTALLPEQQCETIAVSSLPQGTPQITVTGNDPVDVRRGDSGKVTLTVKNSGTANLDVSSITSSNTNITLINPSDLPELTPLSEDYVDVHYIIADDATSFTAPVVVAADGIESQTVYQAFNVDTSEPYAFEVAPASHQHTFNPTALGESDTTRITITNKGIDGNKAPVLQMQGVNRSNFSAEYVSPCYVQMPMSYDQTCEVDVSFVPTSYDETPQEVATLHIVRQNVSVNFELRGTINSDTANRVCLGYNSILCPHSSFSLPTIGQDDERLEVRLRVTNNTEQDIHAKLQFVNPNDDGSSNSIYAASNSPDRTIAYRSVSEGETKNFSAYIKRNELKDYNNNKVRLTYKSGTIEYPPIDYAISYSVSSGNLVISGDEFNEVFSDTITSRPLPDQIGKISSNRFAYAGNSVNSEVTIKIEGRGDIRSLTDQQFVVNGMGHIPSGQLESFYYTVINTDSNRKFSGELCIVEVGNSSNAACFGVSGQADNDPGMYLDSDGQFSTANGDNGVRLVSIHSTHSGLNNSLPRSGNFKVPDNYLILGRENNGCTGVNEVNATSMNFDFANEASSKIDLCVQFVPDPTKPGSYQDNFILTANPYSGSTNPAVVRSHLVYGITDPGVTVLNAENGIVDFGPGIVGQSYSGNAQVRLVNYGNLPMSVNFGENTPGEFAQLSLTDTDIPAGGQAVDRSISATVLSDGEREGAICYGLNEATRNQCFDVKGEGIARAEMNFAQGRRMYQFLGEAAPTLPVQLQWATGVVANAELCVRVKGQAVAGPFSVNGQQCITVNQGHSEVTLGYDHNANQDIEGELVMTFAASGQIPQNVLVENFSAITTEPNVDVGSHQVSVNMYLGQQTADGGFYLTNTSGAPLDVQIDGASCSGGLIQIVDNSDRCVESLHIGDENNSYEARLKVYGAGLPLGTSNFTLKVMRNGVEVANQAINLAVNVSDINTTSNKVEINYCERQPYHLPHVCKFPSRVLNLARPTQKALLNYTIERGLWLRNTDTQHSYHYNITLSPVLGNLGIWSGTQLTGTVAPGEQKQVLFNVTPTQVGEFRAAATISLQRDDGPVINDQSVELVAHSVDIPEFFIAVRCGTWQGHGAMNHDGWLAYAPFRRRVEHGDHGRHKNRHVFPQGNIGEVINTDYSSPIRNHCSVSVNSYIGLEYRPDWTLTGTIDVQGEAVDEIFCHSQNPNCTNWQGQYANFPYKTIYFRVRPQSELSQITIPVTINTVNGVFSKTFTFPVTGITNNAKLKVDECANGGSCVLSFDNAGSQLTGSNEHSFTLTNTEQTKVAMLKGSVDIDNGSFQLISGDPTFELAKGESKVFTYRFIGEGAQQARVTIHSNELSGGTDKPILLRSGAGSQAKSVMLELNDFQILAH